MLPWHHRQWEQLDAAVAGGRLPHGLLLTGPDGVGLREFALAFARARLCVQSANGGMACGVCGECLLTGAGNHPDLRHVQPEEPGKQIRVEEVRTLLEFMHLTSKSGHTKIAIIEPAEAMNRNAANALLKTLEEPPPGAILLLCCHEPGRLAVTIRSRCQQLDFHGDRSSRTRDWLAARLGVAGTEAEDLLQRAGGAPFRAVRLKETGALEKQAALLEELCRLRREAGNPIPVAQAWVALGVPDVLVWLQEILRHAVAYKIAPGAAGNLSSESGHLQQIADELDLSQLVASHDLALQGYQRATGTISLGPQALLEEFIVHWQSIAKPRRR